MLFFPKSPMSIFSKTYFEDLNKKVGQDAHYKLVHSADSALTLETGVKRSTFELRDNI